MPDQTPETPRSTSGSGDEAWADDVLARARARSVAQESADPEPAGPGGVGVLVDHPVHLRCQCEDHLWESPIHWDAVHCFGH
ncbi:MAG: hypothetical protein MKZ66_10795, partial [Acidimicrobiales bacterium]|nr:hypothetical protein [Acidimicrobiales bacterium]